MPEQESHFIDLNITQQLHLKRFCHDKNGHVVFMLHGSIENGRIFYSSSGKGFAPYLAQHGYDVFIGDLRGRGLSFPPIGSHAFYGQTEAITQDIPAFLKTIEQIRGEKTPIFFIAHSWGGVLLLSYLARFATHRDRIPAMVLFATKRRMRGFSFEKWFKIHFMWAGVGRLILKYYGYLPTRELGVGSDNETATSYLHTLPWMAGAWVDPVDRFDYGKAIQAITLPPILSLAGAGDTYLGHPPDVYHFVIETGAKQKTFQVLGRSKGNLHDYGHNTILTHPDAPSDHFPMICDWLKQHLN